MTMSASGARENMFTYDDALRTLSEALTFGIEPSLDGIRALTDELGRPQDRFVSLQVAGTNGKSSTSRMLAAILREHGFSTGLYTSPELVFYPERFEIAGNVISDRLFAHIIEEAVSAAERISARSIAEGHEAVTFTEFELLTAAALILFAENAVDFAVLEVGMGGRWDATSVVDPSVAVITGIDLDHTRILGDTVDEIASEKAAIIVPACAPVIGPGTAATEQVFLDRASECDTQLRSVREGVFGSETAVSSPAPEELTTRFLIHQRPSALFGGEPFDDAPERAREMVVVDVFGAHGDYLSLAMRAPAYQAQNIATAVAAAEAALGRRLDVDAIRRALATLFVPGRFEVLAKHPLLVIDASHNPQSARVLAETIRGAFDMENEPANKPVLLLAVLSDKDAHGIVSALAPVVDRFVVTQSDSLRSRTVSALAAIVAEVTGVVPETFVNPADALVAIRGGVGDSGNPCAPPVIVSGSITIAGQVKKLFLECSDTSVLNVKGTD